MSDQPKTVVYLDAMRRRANHLGDELRNELPEGCVDVVTTLTGWRERLDRGLSCVVVGARDESDDTAVSILETIIEEYPGVDTVLVTDGDDPAVVERAYDVGVDEVVQYTGAEAASILTHEVATLATLEDASGADVPPGVHLREVVDATEDAILTIDTESRIRYATSSLADVLGYAPEEAVGESLTTLMTDDLAARHLDGLQRYLETGERSFDWTDVELFGQHRDGHQVPLSVSFAEVTAGRTRYFTGILRDISDRKQREKRLARHEAVAQTVGDGLYALDDEGRFLTVNDAYTELLGYDRQRLLGESADEFLHERVSAEARRLQADMEDGGSETQTLETVLRTADGEVVPVEIRISLFPLDDDQYGQVGVVRDITERRRREERLAQLNEVAQVLTAVETAAEVADVVVETAHETLGLPLTTVELYDTDEGRLESVTRTDGVTELVGDGSLFASERGLPWRVYAESEGRVIHDVSGAADIADEETPLESVIVLPIGEHGVFVTGATTADAFDDAEVTIARILASNAQASLDRVEREQELRTQKEHLEEQKTALERIERINGVIRNITQSLTHATTREEIETAVCEELTVRGPYTFSWIGEQKSIAGSEVIPRVSAGDGDGYLDAVAVSTGDDTADGSDPTGRAFRTHEPRVETNLNTDPPFEPWRIAALERDFRSSIAIPLAYDEKLYGVLTIFADRTGLFDDMAVAVLEELGEMVGYAINAMERKKMLVSDAAVALEFELTDQDIPAIRFARETNGRFEFDDLVQQTDGGYRVFFTITGVDPETVYEFSDRGPSVRDLTFISERDDGVRFEATIGDDGFFGKLVSYGAYPKEMAASGESARVEVELPRSGDIQSFIRMFLDTYEGAELVARQERDRPIQTREEFQAIYREALTMRQEEVIKTAYFSGFFEWPRESTGQEVAEMLGVSQPTVNRHIRNGEKTLMSLVFDDNETERG